MSTTELSPLETSALEHVWFHATSHQSLTSPGGLLDFESGEGCYLTDIHGRTYLDALSGGGSESVETALKIAKQVLILEEIPKGATGKIQRVGPAAKLGL